MANKVLFVCACCERYHQGIKEGKVGCGLKMGLECGSPMTDHTFPEYRGPLSPFQIRAKCFVCGCEHNPDGSRVKQLMITGVLLPHERRQMKDGPSPTIGCCEEHLHTAREAVHNWREQTNTRDHVWWRLLDV